MILYLRNTLFATLLFFALPVIARSGYEISLTGGQGRVLGRDDMAKAFSAGFSTETYRSENFIITTGMKLSVIGNKGIAQFDVVPAPDLTRNSGLLFASLPVGFSYRKHTNGITFTAGANALLNYFISVEDPADEAHCILGWGIEPNISGSFDISGNFALGIKIFAMSGSGPLKSRTGLQTSMYGAGLVFNVK